MAEDLEPLPPLFTDINAPVQTYGALLADCAEDVAVQQSFSEILSEARRRVGEAFAPLAAEPCEQADFLERTIKKMWNQGWSPETADLELFTRDFGAVFAGAIHEAMRGEWVFRSETNLMHTSLFWRAARVEVFPFHRVHNRLLSKDGDDLVYFYNSVADVVS